MKSSWSKPAIISLLGVLLSCEDPAVSRTYCPRVGVIQEILDGDTVIITDRGMFEYSVRFNTVDAMEKDTREGRRAGRRVAELLPQGTPVCLAYIEWPRGRDRWGRLLADIILADGRNVSRVLLDEGLVSRHRGEDEAR